MKRTLAITRQPNTPAEYRVILYPEYTESGFYREGLSLDSFKHREARRAFPKGQWKESGIKWTSIIYEHDMTKNFTVEMYADGKTWEDLPVFSNVWQFYKDIGYDYKRKKYEESV